MRTKKTKKTQQTAEQKWEEQKKQLAISQSHLFTVPVLGATSAITCLCSMEELKPDMETLLRSLNSKIQKIHEGNLSDIEETLTTQAQTLNIVFNRMLMRMGISKRVDAMQQYADIAFKAQNQARKTLLALVELKNPRKAIFIKQQNQASVQQVNNSVPIENSKNNFPKNELLCDEVKNETLEARGTFKAIPIDSQLEAVGAVIGAQNS